MPNHGWGVCPESASPTLRCMWTTWWVGQVLFKGRFWVSGWVCIPAGSQAMWMLLWVAREETAYRELSVSGIVKGCVKDGAQMRAQWILPEARGLGNPHLGVVVWAGLLRMSRRLSAGQGGGNKGSSKNTDLEEMDVWGNKVAWCHGCSTYKGKSESQFYPENHTGGKPSALLRSVSSILYV